MSGKHRRGTTLLEMAAVMGVLAIVLAGSVVAVGAMYRVERLVKDRIDHDRAASRLAQQLRVDAHAARSAELAPGPQPASAVRLILGAGRTIDYKIDEGGVRRVVSHDGETAHREAYLFGALAEADRSLLGDERYGWSTAADAESRRLTLAIPAAPSGRSEAEPPVVKIEAALGLDWQYTSAEDAR